jgi:hypothetical protein
MPLSMGKVDGETPEAAARTLLMVIHKNPAAVIQAFAASTPGQGCCCEFFEDQFHHVQDHSQEKGHGG